MGDPPVLVSFSRIRMPFVIGANLALICCRGLCALVQARHCKTEFDYASYATVRLDAFDLHRASRNRGDITF